MKMAGSTFTHSPSLSSIFFPSNSTFQSLPSTLIPNYFPSKLPTSPTCSLKKIKSLEIGFIPHGDDNLDAVKSGLFSFHTDVSKGNANGTTPYNHFLKTISEKSSKWDLALLFGPIISVISPGVSYASDSVKINEMYQVGELFDFGIQLIYLLLWLGLLGAGTYYVIRQVLLRRELDLSAKELQEQVRSGDASATELFKLGAVMLRRKFYPAATKFLLQAIEKWDGESRDLAQVDNALGVSYVRDGKLDKGIAQFETAVKIQPGYITAWNNLGDAYDSKKEFETALKAFEEVLLFDPNNDIARPRRDALKELVGMSKGVTFRYREN